MLKAEISLTDLEYDPTFNGHSIAFGGSWIEPFPHEALECIFVATDGQWFAIIRERVKEDAIKDRIRTKFVDAETYEALYKETLLWPLDYLMVETLRANKRVRLRAGAFGTAPIYFCFMNEKLSISWDFTDFLSIDRLIDREIMAHYVALNTFYTTRLPCVGVFLLTERASFFVDPNGSMFRYPPPFEGAEVLEGASDREALEAFESILVGVIAKRSIQPARAALELSGGMDSATVALAASKTCEKLMSLGILLDGANGGAQRARRRAIVSKLPLQDFTIQMRDFLPVLDLSPSGSKKEYPLGELYLEAFEAIWDGAQRNGRTFMLSGVGGDELAPIYASEATWSSSIGGQLLREVTDRAIGLLSAVGKSAVATTRAFDAPNGPVPMTDLLAHAGHAPFLLRRGLWPINPLSDPSVVSLCHSLPRTVRHQRKFMKDYLRRHLGAKLFSNEYAKETFEYIFPNLIAQKAQEISAQLRDCALADLGIVDQRAVLKLLAEVTKTRAVAATAPLAIFLWLERFTRQVA